MEGLKQKIKEKAKSKIDELKKLEKPTKAEINAKIAALDKRIAELEVLAN